MFNDILMCNIKIIGDTLRNEEIKNSKPFDG